MTRLPRQPLGQSLLPQMIRKDVWYFEEGRHLKFVVQDGARTIQFRVPLHRLEKTLRRSPKKRKLL